MILLPYSSPASCHVLQQLAHQIKITSWSGGQGTKVRYLYLSAKMPHSVKEAVLLNHFMASDCSRSFLIVEIILVYGQQPSLTPAIWQAC